MDQVFEGVRSLLEMSGTDLLSDIGEMSQAIDSILVYSEDHGMLYLVETIAKIREIEDGAECGTLL